MSASPFADALGPVEAQLPKVFQDQLLGANVLLQGELDVVWHRPRWIRPLLSLLARRNVLFPEVGERVPASLRIEAVEAGHAWHRRFAFPAERRFDALLVFDDEDGLIERLGRLEVGWDLRFRPPDRMEISTRGATLRIGRWRAPLPRLLRPDVTAVQVARAPDVLAVTMVVSHPLVGPFFGYSGTFTLRALANATA
jgi:hypothetical protein